MRLPQSRPCATNAFFCFFLAILWYTKQEHPENEVSMKKVLCAGLIALAAAFSAHGIGFYFDAGIGIGPAWSTMDGENFVESRTASGRLHEFAVDMGLKLGLGPFDTIPLYAVGVVGGVGHQISDDYSNHILLASYLIGPGVIFYPIPSVQIAASLGYSFLSNNASFTDDRVLQESKGGFAGDLSVAFDLGAGNHALLGGFRFFGSTNTLELTGDVQNTVMLSMFLRYAFRHKR
jgi:hypothetical protein